MDRSEIYIFFISLFIALTFTSAGLYLSDELSPANQLHQIIEGHQLTYHEDKYGFYQDGTIDKSIIGSNRVMIYPLVIPILSLPMYFTLAFIPNIGMALWLIGFGIIGTLISIRLNNYIPFILTMFIGAVSVFFYAKLPIDTIEVTAIVLTTTILYGMFGLYIWKLIDYLVKNTDHRIFIWISTLACSSLLFWAGVLKDHVLIGLLFIIIIYYLIKFINTNSILFLLYTGLASGLLIWERPEISIAILPIVLILLLYYVNIKSTLFYTLFTSIGLIPMFINNYIVTGSVLKFPFQAVKQTLFGAHLASNNNVIDILVTEVPTFILKNLSLCSIENILSILFKPYNGGVGLFPILMLSIILTIIILYNIFINNIKLLRHEIIIYLFCVSLTITYLFTSALSFNLHMETGMLPDMRYFTPIYAPFTIVSLLVITRIYPNLNLRQIFKNLLIFFAIILLIFTLLLINYGGFIISITSINLITNVVACILMTFIIGLSISNYLTKKSDTLETIIPLMIVLPLVWQIYAAVFTVKLYGTPMLIPLSNFIKLMIIGA